MDECVLRRTQIRGALADLKDRSFNLDFDSAAAIIIEGFSHPWSEIRKDALSWAKDVNLPGQLKCSLFAHFIAVCCSMEKSWQIVHGALMFLSLFSVVDLEHHQKREVQNVCLLHMDSNSPAIREAATDCVHRMKFLGDEIFYSRIEVMAKKEIEVKDIRNSDLFDGLLGLVLVRLQMMNDEELYSSSSAENVLKLLGGAMQHPSSIARQRAGRGMVALYKRSLHGTHPNSSICCDLTHELLLTSLGDQSNDKDIWMLVEISLIVAEEVATSLLQSRLRDDKPAPPQAIFDSFSRIPLQVRQALPVLLLHQRFEVRRAVAQAMPSLARAAALLAPCIHSLPYECGQSLPGDHSVHDCAVDTLCLSLWLSESAKALQHVTEAFASTLLAASSTLTTSADTQEARLQGQGQGRGKGEGQGEQKLGATADTSWVMSLPCRLGALDLKRGFHMDVAAHVVRACSQTAAGKLEEKEVSKKMRRSAGAVVGAQRVLHTSVRIMLDNLVFRLGLVEGREGAGGRGVQWGCDALEALAVADAATVSWSRLELRHRDSIAELLSCTQSKTPRGDSQFASSPPTTPALIDEAHVNENHVYEGIDDDDDGYNGMGVSCPDCALGTHRSLRAHVYPTDATTRTPVWAMWVDALIAMEQPAPSAGASAASIVVCHPWPSLLDPSTGSLLRTLSVISSPSSVSFSPTPIQCYSSEHSSRPCDPCPGDRAVDDAAAVGARAAAVAATGRSPFSRWLCESLAPMLMARLPQLQLEPPHLHGQRERLGDLGEQQQEGQEKGVPRSGWWSLATHVARWLTDALGDALWLDGSTSSRHLLARLLVYLVETAALHHVPPTDPCGGHESTLAAIVTILCMDGWGWGRGLSSRRRPSVFFDDTILLGVLNAANMALSAFVSQTPPQVASVASHVLLPPPPPFPPVVPTFTPKQVLGDEKSPNTASSSLVLALHRLRETLVTAAALSSDGGCDTNDGAHGKECSADDDDFSDWDEEDDEDAEMGESQSFVADGTGDPVAAKIQILLDEINSCLRT